MWNKDLGNSGHVAIPDGVTSNGTSNTDDPATLVNLKAAGYSAGYGILSDSAVGNRKGFAGYEFDPILEGAASGDNKPIYHVRHRVLASDTGKWFQKDPLGYHDSMDLYEYCRSDPEDRRDPMGLACGSCSKSAPLSSTAAAYGFGNNGNLLAKAVPPAQFCDEACQRSCEPYIGLGMYWYACYDGCYRGCTEAANPNNQGFPPNCFAICDPYQNYPLMYIRCFEECRAWDSTGYLPRPLSPADRPYLPCELQYYTDNMTCEIKYQFALDFYDSVCGNEQADPIRRLLCEALLWKINADRTRCLHKADRDYFRCRNNITYPSA